MTDLIMHRVSPVVSYSSRNLDDCVGLGYLLEYPDLKFSVSEASFCLSAAWLLVELVYIGDSRLNSAPVSKQSWHSFQ
jgi:hypothetical protein